MEEKKLQELKELAASTKIDVVRNLLEDEKKETVIKLFNLYVLNKKDSKESILVKNDPLFIHIFRNAVGVERFNKMIDNTNFYEEQELYQLITHIDGTIGLYSYDFEDWLQGEIYDDINSKFVEFVIDSGFYNLELSYIALNLAI